MERKCVACDNKVVSKNKTVRYCSVLCARRNVIRARSGPLPKVRIFKNCPSCEKEFTTRWDKQICCSRSCARAYDAKKNGGHSWTYKGGTSKHASGYIKELDKTHPYADESGYVMQHRLVMERSLGRKLGASERVHHKNGVRNDNRIENLELWMPVGQNTKDPSGARVIDVARDAISKLSTEDRNILLKELQNDNNSRYFFDDGGGF